MTERAIWKGILRFPGVDIPVRLLNTVREERILFHLLHSRDRVRLKQQMVCAYEKVPIPAEEQTKGFAWGEGKYILLDPSELEKTEPEDSRLIEIHEFVKVERIDPLFRDRVYTLEPEAASHTYGALAAALAELSVEGICTWTMRRRSFFGALQTDGQSLRLNTLRHADEVIPVRSLQLPDVPLSEKELMIGAELIDRLSEPFEPAKFADEHQRKLRRLIERKARGEEIALVRPKRLKPTASDELLKALEASLKKVA